MIAAAAVGATAGYAAGLLLAPLHPLGAALGVAAVFGAVYVGAGIALGVPQARAFAAAVLARLQSGR
jgi:hypothetical protein